MGGRERRVKQDTPRITLERYNSLCPPGKKKDKMAVSRGHFSDMAIGAQVVMTVIAKNTGIYGIEATVAIQLTEMTLLTMQSVSNSQRQCHKSIIMLSVQTPYMYLSTICKNYY